MANLTETALYIKKLLNLTIIGIILAVILKIILSAGISYWTITHPKSLSPPTVSFGKLPAIKFPKESSSRPLNYNLETIEGRVPEATSQARVFFIPKKLPSLLASEKARQFAKNLGFQDEPTQETPTLFRFVDADYPGRALSLDIINNNFSLKYDVSAEPAVLEEKPLLTNNEAILEAKNFFQKAGSFPEDLAAGKNRVSLLRLNGEKFEEVGNLTDAQAQRIDFFKNDLDDRLILPSFFSKSNFYAILSGSSNPKKRILEAGFTNWPEDRENWATYPLKTSQTAWEELKNNGGFIASLGQNKETAIIRRVYLAYYDSQEPQTYLQPIFVFEGDNNFAAYVSAVDPEWLE